MQSFRTLVMLFFLFVTNSHQKLIKKDLMKTDLFSIPLEEVTHLSDNEQNQVIYKNNNFQSKVVFNNQLLYSLELSPSQKFIAFFFYPEKHTDDKLKLMIFDIFRKPPQEILSSDFDTASYLHWLGEENIFFTTHCGSSCEGFDLLNIRSKKILRASITSFSADRGAKIWTVFDDWSNNKFGMDGVIKNIRGEIKGEKDYLIFEMEDSNGKDLGKKRFLFVGRTLRLVGQ